MVKKSDFIGSTFKIAKTRNCVKTRNTPYSAAICHPRIAEEHTGGYVYTIILFNFLAYLRYLIAVLYKVKSETNQLNAFVL